MTGILAERAAAVVGIGHPGVVVDVRARVRRHERVLLGLRRVLDRLLRRRRSLVGRNRRVAGIADRRRRGARGQRSAERSGRGRAKRLSRLAQHSRLPGDAVDLSAIESKSVAGDRAPPAGKVPGSGLSRVRRRDAALRLADGGTRNRPTSGRSTKPSIDAYRIATLRRSAGILDDDRARQPLGVELLVEVAQRLDLEERVERLRDPPLDPAADARSPRTRRGGGPRRRS